MSPATTKLSVPRRENFVSVGVEWGTNPSKHFSLSSYSVFVTRNLHHLCIFGRCPFLLVDIRSIRWSYIGSPFVNFVALAPPYESKERMHLIKHTKPIVNLFFQVKETLIGTLCKRNAVSSKEQSTLNSKNAVRSISVTRIQTGDEV